MRSPPLARWPPLNRFIPPWLNFGLIVLILIGIGLHGYRLGYKLYWHDEVFTSLRAAGYQAAEIGDALFRDQTFTPGDLLVYQSLKPNSGPADTVQSLALEDPQHPPLYFVLTRWWMRLLGDSVVSTRSLSVAFSLLTLPVMYGLSLELFASPLAARLSMLLLAVSPFDILFAQLARQYSLLTLLIVLSSWLLLRMRRSNRPLWFRWGAYVLASTAGLYTQPFFGLTLFAHGSYVLSRQLLIAPSRLGWGHEASQQPRSIIGSYLTAIGVIMLLFAPWAWVIVSNFEQVQETTSWSQGFPGWEVSTKLWMLSVTALFFDLNIDFESWLIYVIRAPYLVLIGYGFWAVSRHARPESNALVQTSFWVPFLLLAGSDLVLGTHRSIVSRYLAPCFPAIQLAVGYALASAYNRFGKRLWGILLTVLLSGSLASILVSAHTVTWWNRVPSVFNAAVASEVNALQNPLLVSDDGGSHTMNLAELISIARLLNDDVKLLILASDSTVALETVEQIADVVYFRPSPDLRLRTNQLPNGPLEPIEETAATLWKLSEP